MSITTLWSYVTTGTDVKVHWSSVNADRAINMLPELAFSDGYAVGDLSLDLDAVDSVNIDIISLENAFVIAGRPRDDVKNALRKSLMNFRQAVSLWLPGSSYERALPKTFPPKASEEKTFKSLDEMANLWARIDADSGSPDFTPPLVLRGNYSLAMFAADLATLRDHYKAVHDAADALRFARKQRDVLLGPFRRRLVQYRKVIAAEYGAEHPFFLSLPAVYPRGGRRAAPVAESVAETPSTP